MLEPEAKEGRGSLSRPKPLRSVPVVVPVEQ
jgi:hypothetical protein